jgi:polyisoprenoid-binding protein YceI
MSQKYHSSEFESAYLCEIKSTLMSSTKWVLDPTHSSLSFKVKHLMITNVKGNFNQFEVDVQGDSFESASIHVVVDVSSVHTNNSDRDGHLKSPDFFDVANFPQIIFHSTAFSKKDSENYVLSGNLTIKNVTRPVELMAEFGGINKDPWGNEKAAFEISGTINREDFSLSYNAPLETGGVLIGTEIKISGDMQFVRKTA